ncbi:hypothetical protein Sjap_002901 [Stephania japonica]|uniref:Uncharacterized protein n=1 Tax=Stephania japonica TaxID=461633 RepID=A0AAP0KMQ1_9MAGN
MDVETTCHKEEKTVRGYTPVIDNELPEPPIEPSQSEPNYEPVVEGTCDDVAEHHTDVLHDDLHAFKDFKNIVPQANIQRRLKGKKPLVEKPSKK